MTETPHAYQTTVGAFHGPLDLLLSLIEKRKLHINELSLSQVADTFLSYVQSREEYPVDEATRFLGVAATLLLIKSRSLLPALPLSEEEEEDVADLERRLALLACYRELARALQTRFGNAPLMPLEAHPLEAPVFAPHEALTRISLHDALIAMLARQNAARARALPKAKVAPVVSIGEMMTRLRERVLSMPTRWSELMAEEGGNRRAVAVCFLAVLELLRHGKVEVHQEARFSDMLIRSDGTEVPRY